MTDPHSVWFSLSYAYPSKVWRAQTSIVSVVEPAHGHMGDFLAIQLLRLNVQSSLQIHFVILNAFCGYLPFLYTGYELCGIVLCLFYISCYIDSYLNIKPCCFPWTMWYVNENIQNGCDNGRWDTPATVGYTSLLTRLPTVWLIATESCPRYICSSFLQSSLIFLFIILKLLR